MSRTSGGIVVPSALTAGTTAPIGYQVSVARTADTAARTNNTLANDDASGGTLQFAIGTSATEMYGVQAYLIFNAANVTMDIKVGWNASGLPSGATAKWGTIAGLNGVGPTSTSGYMGVLTSATPAVLTAVGGTISHGSPAGETGIALAGTVFGGGNAGNITLAWAQATTDAGNLVLKAGSYLLVTKLAA